MNIKFVNLRRQYLSLKDEIDGALRRVIENSAFIGGEEVSRFEENFAAACGTRFCVGVGNGTDALFIALKAMGVGQGDEVATVANSYFATSEAIVMAGARPVFVDCDPVTFTMDVQKLAACLKERIEVKKKRVKAILPVHLYGRMAAMDPILDLARHYGLRVIEDCAQAHLAEYRGKKAGSLGDAGCFSFYPSKNLGAFGDAGAITTNDPVLAADMRMFANHGQASRYDHRMAGINSRLDGLQAAVLNVKLPFLLQWSKSRRTQAMLYHRLLGDIDGLLLPDIPSDGSHVMHLYVVRVQYREQVMARLAEEGIPTVVHYPTALPNLPAHADLGYTPDDFPVASLLAREVLSLPMYPELKELEIVAVCDALRFIYNEG